MNERWVVCLEEIENGKERGKQEEIVEKERIGEWDHGIGGQGPIRVRSGQRGVHAE